MGVKSTVELSRKQAIYRYVEWQLKQARQEWEVRAISLSNEDLETLLEDQSDIDAGGSGFSNFSIVRE